MDRRAWILVALAALAALLAALGRRREASTPPAPPPRAEQAPPRDVGSRDPAPTPSAPAPTPDGSPDRERERRAREDFDVARQLFSAEVGAKAREVGPAAAFQVLDAALRGPFKNLESKARAYEAAQQLLLFLADASQGKREPRDFTPLLPAMLERVRGLLLDGSADGGLRRVLLAGLGGIRPEFHFEDDDVFVLAETPFLSTSERSPASPAVPALADALWTLARDPAAPVLLRADALLAVGRQGGEGTRELLLRLGADADANIRRAAVASLASRGDALSVAEVREVWNAQRDPLSRVIAIRGLAAPLAAEPFVRDALLSTAAAPPPPEGVRGPQAVERRAALAALLDGFSRSRDPATLAALEPHAARWARERWASTSPLVTLAELAIERDLRGLGPLLRAAAPQVPDLQERARVEQIAEALSR